MSKEEEDPDIAIIKARKMKVLREQAAELEKARIERQRLQESKVQHKRGNREIISDYLYDRGEEVLKLAESQFPIQTKSLVSEIVELIRIGEIKQKISGSFFRNTYCIQPVMPSKNNLPYWSNNSAMMR